MIGFLRSMLGRVWPGKPLSDPNPYTYWGGRDSTAGATVTRDSALSLSAVFAAVGLLSRLIASLPLHVYHVYGRSKEKATSHPAYRILHHSPNPEMTAFSFRQCLEFHRLLCGNAYAEVVWAGNGKPAAVWPVEGWRVRPKRRENGDLYYEIDGEREIETEDLLHIPLMSTDGVVGRSFLDFAVESLGLGIATQEFAAAWFGNGARPGAILQHPGNPNKEARNEFRRGWEERHKGSGKSGGTAVLWGGWTWVGTDGQVDPQKSQLLEQRRFSTEEVSRWLGIPPHLLYDLTRATFSNIEQQNLDFLVYSFGPILTSYEQEFDRKLLSPPSTYCKHSVNGLLRGDSASRSAFYREMINIGVLSPNDVRDLEDLNPVEGGDTYFFPLNMAPLDSLNKPATVVEPGPSPPASEPAPQPEAPAVPSLTPVLEEALHRLARVEIQAAKRAALKPGKFLAWMEEWYPPHELRLVEALSPIIGDRASAVAKEWVSRSSEQLLSLADSHTPATFAEGAESLLASWGARVESETRRILEGSN